MPREEGGFRFRRVVAGCALFVAAFLVRVLSWPLVFRESGVQPAGSDAFYHLRRIAYSVENFPGFLGRDAYLNYPHGGEAIWSPAFDWTLAALGWSFVGAGDPASLERLLVWVPPILGAATVVLLYCLALRHFSQWVAVVASALLCVLPAHALYSRLGAIDHHVAVALCAAWMLSVALRLLDTSPAGPLPTAAQWRVAGWLGSAMATALIVWPGALIHVAGLQAALFARVLAADRRDSATAWSWLVAGCHAVAFALVLPFATGRQWQVWGDFSPVVLSNFQPIYLACSALCSVLLAQLWQRWRFPDSTWLRVAQAVALVGLVAGLALLGLPALGEAAADAWAWFSKAETFQAAVAESSPLFSRGSGFEGGRAALLLSGAVYLVPFAIVGLALSLRGAAFAWRPALVLWLAALFFVATLVQRRFMNSFSLFHVLVLALAGERLLLALRARLPGIFSPRGASLAAFALALVLAYPMLGAYRNDLENLGRLARGQPARAVGTELFHATLLPVAEWLREHSPETSGFFDASEEPEYGLLSAWGDGHLLSYSARRPAVQGNFGDDVGEHNFELADRYFSARRERDAVRMLREVGARYVIVRRSGSGHTSAGHAVGSLWSRLYLPVRDAAEGSRAADAPPELTLVQHRLIHESEPPPEGMRRFPFYAVYELVEGARVTGSAQPGSLVEAQLALISTHGAELRFATGVLAGADGRYRLTLPYPNQAGASSVQTGSRYLIRNRAEQAQIAVSETDVREGLVVAGPDFGAGS